ncbi:MAG: Crp/Fnr family transcriptional regulator [Gammaproteobacteria bacterium]|nr:Crp/Fnr family transcriptional regulator [Gammaproteobacteria bacterium]
MAVTTQLLRRFPILSVLPDDSVSQLANQSTLREFARRGMVLSAGERNGSACFLFDGRLQGIDFTLDGREVGLYFVEPGDFCGELALFDQGEQPEHVMALTRSLVVFVPILALRNVMFDSRAMLESLCERVAGRVRLMSAQRGLLGLPNIGQRVCGQLWMLISEQDKRTQHDIAIRNPPTHQEIAIMLNLSRETVTRVFQTLQSNRIVKRDGTSRLLISDPARLRQLALGEAAL